MATTSAKIAHAHYTVLTRYSAEHGVDLPFLAGLTVELTEAVERIIGEDTDARLTSATEAVEAALEAADAARDDRPI